MPDATAFDSVSTGSPPPVGPKPPSHAAGFVAHAITTLAVASLISLAVAVGWVVPSFRHTFADFDVAIPALTVAVLNVSGPPGGVALGAIAIALVVVSIAGRRRPAAVALLAIFVLLATMLASVICVLAVAMPLVKVVQSAA
ncbi:MAG: hypothetical protein AAF586_09390 [Planctomycetota bacterium]